LFIIELRIALNIQQPRLNNVIEEFNVENCSNLNSSVVKSNHCYAAVFVQKNVLHHYI